MTQSSSRHRTANLILAALLAPVLTALPGTSQSRADPTTSLPDGVFQDCPDCPEMVRLPPGTVRLGSPPNAPRRDPDEGPVRPIRLDHGFAIGRYEVTVAQYAAFVAATGHPGGRCYVDRGRGTDDWGWAADAGWSDPYFAQTDRHPVTCVHWHDAQAYVSWLSERTGKPYRLPSEAEWAYAARAGNAGPSPADWANGICRHANVADRDAGAVYPHWSVADCRDGFVFTAPVGRYAPNAFGLFDTVGNVWEWVADCYHDSLAGVPEDGQAWQDAACDQYVLRGASWLDRPAYVRLANRIEDRHRGSIFGFRVVRDF